MAGDCHCKKPVHFMMNGSFNEFLYSLRMQKKNILGVESISNKLSFLKGVGEFTAKASFLQMC
jgi:hypothetical protein